MSRMSGSFDFDGTAVPFTAGQSVGAALLAARVRSWRTTRQEGRPRGIFCGIGVCFDCLVTVDGVPNRRACMVRAERGLEVRTEKGASRADIGA